MTIRSLTYDGPEDQQDQKTVRIDMPCALAGFEPPPCPAHIRFTESEGRLVATVLTRPGRPPALAQWLQPHRPDAVSIPPGLSPRTVRAEFSRVPAEWSCWMSDLDVQYLDLHPEGTASAFVTGTEEAVEAMANGTTLDGCPVHVRPVHGEADLTARQEEVLSAAVRLGYYDMPHRTDLRTLGSKMGISVGSVSTLLRRAEAAVIHAFVDNAVHERWAAHDARTDARSSDPLSSEPINLTRSQDPMRMLDEILDGSAPMPPWPRPGWGRKDARPVDEAGPTPERPKSDSGRHDCVCGADEPVLDRDRIRSWPPHRSQR